METYFFISSVSCFHVFPCVHFQYTLPAPARACVLRDLTNEHKVTKFEQEEEHNDEVGCQDEMPRILFPLPQMLQMRSQLAGMSQSAVMTESTVRSWRRKPNQNPRQDVGHVAFPLAQVENNSTLKHWTARTTMKRRLIEICCYFPYNLHE